MTDTTPVAKCPYCEAMLTRDLNLVSQTAGGHRSLIFACPYCQKVLGVHADPEAITMVRSAQQVLQAATQRP